MMRTGFGGAIRLVVAGGLATAAMAIAPPSLAVADWLGPEHRLTTGAAIENWPRLSGNRLVYSDYRNERTVGAASDPDTLFDIRVLDLDGGEDQNLTPEHTAMGAAAISGDHVVWRDYGRDGDAGLRLHDLATGAQRRLAAKPGVEPAISGNRVCYEHLGRIYVYDLGTDRETAVSPKDATAGSCDIDGSVVVWQDLRNGRDLDVYAYDLSSRRSTRLTADEADQSLPRIDGDLVVWQDDRNGTTNTDIYLYNLATGATTHVTDAPGLQWFPDIADDRIVWMDERKGTESAEVYLYDLASGVTTRVTTSTGWSGNPTISGGRIVYEDRRTGHDLYLAEVVVPTLTVTADAQIRYGLQAPVTGRLVGADGIPVSGGLVGLEYSTDGRTWVSAGAASTQPDGTFAVVAPSLIETIRVRVRFAGSPEYAAALSPELELRVDTARGRVKVHI